MFDIQTLSLPSLAEAKHFFNSVFVTSVVGSLAGALGGAWAAQRITDRSKGRDELVREIRNTNVATLLAWEFCNTFLSLKRQVVKPFKDEYDATRAAYDEIIRRRNAGELEGEVFEFRMNLQTIDLPYLPMALLNSQLFEKITLSGRPLSLTTVLNRTVEGLERSIGMRNRAIATFHANEGNWTQQDKMAKYFGLRNRGNVDETYPNAMTALYKQTDDGIFFSQLLCKDLIEHGTSLAKAFEAKYGRDRPKVTTLDFGPAEALGLMPAEADYHDFLRAFQKHVEPPTLLQRVRAWLRRAPLFRYVGLK